MDRRQMRFEKQARLNAEADAIRAQALRELNATKPIGRAGEIAEVVGLQLKRGQSAASTPWGLFVWHKATAPSRETIQSWFQRCRKSDALRDEALSLGFYVIDANRTIGNRKPMQDGLRLEAAGLLNDEETTYLRRLEAFWNQYPDADSGTVKSDGSIEPWYRNRKAA